MPTPEFETETFRRVYSNADGSYVEVGPDSDALGLIQLRYREDAQDTNPVRILMPIQQAELVAKAILTTIEERRTALENVLSLAPK